MKDNGKIIAVLGSTGHFGKIIFDIIFENITENQFYVLSRKSPGKPRSREEHFYYDFQKNSKLPEFNPKPDLFLDLTGPVDKDDPVVLEACLQAGIHYMDISMSVHHLEKSLQLFKKYKKGTAIVHTGLFPGFSNLMIADLMREMPRNSEFILAGEFPAYAGGGYKVAQTMEDLLKNSSKGYYFSDGKKIPHNLHEGSAAESLNGKRKNMYHWYLPEMTCLEYSLKPKNFKRLIVIKPSILNSVFGFLIRLLNLSGGNKWFIDYIKWNMFILKKYFFKNNSPSVRMEAIGRLKHSEKRNVLYVKNAVEFHGKVMLGFVNAWMKLPNTKKLNGVFTPEQLFKTEDVLEFGVFEEYSLTRFVF